MRAHTILVLGVLSTTACSGGGASSVDARDLCHLGDASAAPMLEIVNLDAEYNRHSTDPDMQIPLVFPPQGGWIVLLGARATNINGCDVNLTTSVKDVGGSTVLSLDRRPTVLTPNSDGWGISTLSTYGNLPVCPVAAPTRDLHDQPYEFTVELDDAEGKHASQTVTVTPVCPDPDPTGLCLCQCDKDYVLGSCPGA